MRYTIKNLAKEKKKKWEKTIGKKISLQELQSAI